MKDANLKPILSLEFLLTTIAFHRGGANWLSSPLLEDILYQIPF